MSTVDLTTYGGTHGTTLTASASTITAESYERRDNEWYSYDYGDNYFDALNVTFEINTFTGTASGSAVGMYFGVSELSTISGAASQDVGLISSYESAWGPGVRYRLWRGYATQLDDTATLSTNTTYYFTLSRSAGNDVVTCYIYSDSGRTTLVDTLSVSGFTTAKWRWHMGITHPYSGGALEQFNGTIANFDFNLADPAGQPRVGRLGWSRNGLFGPKVF